MVITGIELGDLPQCLTPQQTAIALRCDSTRQKGERKRPQWIPRVFYVMLMMRTCPATIVLIILFLSLYQIPLGLALSWQVAMLKTTAVA